jgi:hypothetical protein
MRAEPERICVLLFLGGIRQRTIASSQDLVTTHVGSRLSSTYRRALRRAFGSSPFILLVLTTQHSTLTRPPNQPTDLMSASQLPAGVADPSWKPEPGRVGNLSAAQQAALDILKEDLMAESSLVEGRMDDSTLLRCVVAPRSPGSGLLAVRACYIQRVPFSPRTHNVHITSVPR